MIEKAAGGRGIDDMGSLLFKNQLLGFFNKV